MQLDEILEEIKRITLEGLPESDISDEQYDDFAYNHKIIAMMIRLLSDHDQKLIDLIDQFDAKHFKEALGL